MNEELGKNAAAEVQPASQGREVQRDLLEALNQMYYAVLRVAPEEDAVTVLQSRDHPENVGKKLQWSAYLEHYRSMLTENGKKKLQERLSCQALQAAAKSKGEDRPGFTLEVSCSIGIAFAPADGVNYAALSSAADRRAYRAKAQGKDRFAYRD